jgi:hypothetical protein
MNKRVIFIAGSSHSGSTLLGCILGSHPENPFNYFHVGEVHAFFSPTHEKYGKPYGAIQAGGTIWKDIDYTKGYSGAYRELFHKSEADVIIDSSKNLNWLRLQYSICKKEGWDFQLIVSYRTFDGIWNSSEKRNNPVSWIISNLMYYHHLLSVIKDVGLNIDVLDLTLLINNPSEMVQKLCHKTNIPYFFGKELYWRFNHYYVYGAAAQRKHLAEPAKAAYYRSSDLNCRNIDQLPLNANQKRLLKDAEAFLKSKIIRI